MNIPKSLKEYKPHICGRFAVVKFPEGGREIAFDALAKCVPLGQTFQTQVTPAMPTKTDPCGIYAFMAVRWNCA